ncbi:hypothetical protein BJ165DRAFT_1491939 [Panaeolus papilionaceus]|nr:hypothetical protein BJ165DRAFT_1491939 [Panaeolus papilionaceus]
MYASSLLQSQANHNAIVHSNGVKYFQVAATVMLFYDHMLTFSDEVERVWKQRFTGASLLFYINRYVTAMQAIILLDAFDDPIWTKGVCDHFVIFEGASTTVLIAVCELIMILRVYALYECSTLLLAVLLTIWGIQITVSAVGIHTGQAVPLPSFLTGAKLESVHDTALESRDHCRLHSKWKKSSIQRTMGRPTGNGFCHLRTDALANPSIHSDIK